MTNRDIVEQVAAETGLAKDQTKSIVAAVFAAIGDAASRGEDVSIPGFGKFKVRATAERQGRNPRTGAVLQVAAGKRVAFAPATALKDKVAS